MNPQGADMLSQLRDIHASPPAPWWPPAPGWWILAVLASVALLLVLRRLWRGWCRHRRRRDLLRLLQRIERHNDPVRAPDAFLAEINRLLKWVAVRAFPDQGCAALQGREWTRFLARGIGDSSDVEALSALADGPYEPRPSFDPEAIGRIARQWISRHG